MKLIFYSLVFISTSQAYADFFFVLDDKIYSVVSKYSPQKTSVEKAKYLKIGVIQNLKNGTIKYSLEGIASLDAFDLFKTPAAPEIIVGEGCGKNPMTWLKTSKVLGHLKKKDPAIYIQLPPDATSIEKTALKCRFSDNSLQLSTAVKDLAVLVCSDDLNYNLLLMKEKSIEAELVITDNCP